MKRAPILLLLAATTAHADPPSLAFVARGATIPAGGDHANWEGIDVALEPAALHRTSFRVDLAVDHVKMHSDECTWAYEGTQLTALAGVRVDLRALRPGQVVRPYYTAAAGVGGMRTSHCQAMATTTGRFYVEPVQLGVDFALAGDAALRVEWAMLVTPTDYDPVALIVDAGLAFRL